MMQASRKCLPMWMLDCLPNEIRSACLSVLPISAVSRAAAPAITHSQHRIASIVLPSAPRLLSFPVSSSKFTAISIDHLARSKDIYAHCTDSAAHLSITAPYTPMT